MFNGEKLLELRLLNEYSRAELGELIGLTEQTIWQFETNTLSEVLPSIDSFRFQLAQLFKVDWSYFAGGEIPKVVNTAQIAFRNADIASKKSMKFQEVYVNTANYFIEYLESFLLSPEWLVYELEKEIKEKKKHSELSIEEIANIAKKRLGVLSDNSDILYKIELSGIYVLERSITGGADAYSLWTKKNVPYIVLGKGKSAARRNFDLAHELGHLLLHKEVAFDELNQYEYQKKEQEANQFASSFLLPKEIFVKKFKEMVGKRISHPDSYIQLKEQFNVSIQALEMRAWKLGYLSQSQNSYFYRILNSDKKEYKVLEPLDKEISIKRPTKIRSIMDTLFINDVITLQSLLKSKHIRLVFLSQLFGIELSFFDKYKTLNNNFAELIRVDDYKNRYEKTE